MKRLRNLAIVLAVLVALIVAIFGVKKLEDHVDKVNAIDEIIVTLDAEAVEKITWTGEDDVTMSFTKTDGTWVLDEDEKFPVDQTDISKLLDKFSEVHASFVIEEVEDYGQYGLKNPVSVATFTAAGEDTEISFGGFSTMDNKRYVSIGNGCAYLIDDDLNDYLKTDKNEFLNNDTFTSWDPVNEIIVSGNENIDIVLDEDNVYEYSESFKYYDVAGGGHVPMDSDKVTGYASALAKLSLTDYLTYTASTAEFESEDILKPELEITLKGTEKVKSSNSSTSAITEAVNAEKEKVDSEYTIQISKYVEKAEKKDEEDIIHYYLRFKDSEIIYNLTEEQYETVTACTYDDLRPEKVFTLDWTKVTAVKASFDGNTFELTREAKLDEEGNEVVDSKKKVQYTYRLTNYDVLVDEEKLKEVIDGLTVEEYTGEANKKQSEIELVISLENETYPELTLGLFRNDGQTVAAVYNGETIGYISRSEMIDLRELFVSYQLDNE